jgi:hypothetical protein
MMKKSVKTFATAVQRHRENPAAMNLVFSVSLCRCGKVFQGVFAAPT